MTTPETPETADDMVLLMGGEVAFYQQTSTGKITMVADFGPEHGGVIRKPIPPAIVEMFKGGGGPLGGMLRRLWGK